MGEEPVSMMEAIGLAWIVAISGAVVELRVQVGKIGQALKDCGIMNGKGRKRK